MIKDKSIFIKNIYYMLAYAFTNLIPSEDDEIAAESSIIFTIYLPQFLLRVLASN